MIGLTTAVVVVLALLTVFATQLSSTQAKSRQDVEARVHERGVLAAALIDSLFSSVQQQIPQYSKLYGGRTVAVAPLERDKLGNAYLAVVTPGGAVLAHSTGLTTQARSELGGLAALALVRRGALYGLGDVVPYGQTGTVDLAVKFPSPYGERVLLTGITPAALALFIDNDLREIPGVRGSANYLVDGHGVVLGSTNPRLPAGHVVRNLSVTGEHAGRYYDNVKLADSTWKIVLTAPDGPLFASVSGLRKWVPWLIFIAFAIVAAVAVGLAVRVLRAADQVRATNRRLRDANRELAEMNDALDRRARELARSNAELEQFASIASHDLQEPLRKVRTFTQQLTVIESDRLSEKGRDYIDRANAAAERMQRLIDDLLRYSRVSTHGRPFVRVDLAAVVSEVLQDLELQVSRAEAHVRVGELPAINGDAAQVRHLMQNLISNALKFRREGVAPEVSIDAATDAEKTVMTVTDNGIGFDPQYRGRIFRVFERLNSRSAYPGTGIGLALARKIVERHGGTITADGAPGAGATFTVTLPLHQAEEIISIEHPQDPSNEETHIAA